jgi:hypothetical protein
MSTNAGGPPRGSFVRRVARFVGRPILAPMHQRFDRIEQQLDEQSRLLLEVRDRVEADLTSVVELLVELQRTLDALERARDGTSAQA